MSTVAGQVESKTIRLGSGAPGELSGRMVTLNERTYLNADRSEAVLFGPDAAFLLGNEGDQIAYEDAVSYGLLDADPALDPDADVQAVLPASDTDVDALKVAWNEVAKNQAILDKDREKLEAEKAQFQEDLAAFHAEQNAPPAAEDVSGDTGDATTADEGGSTEPPADDQGDTSGASSDDATTGDTKEKPKPNDKAKAKPETK